MSQNELPRTTVRRPRRASRRVRSYSSVFPKHTPLSSKGQLTIPGAILRQLGWVTGTAVTIETKKGRIIVGRAGPLPEEGSTP
jgi:hypothetical protein